MKTIQESRLALAEEMRLKDNTITCWGLKIEGCKKANSYLDELEYHSFLAQNVFAM